MTAIPVPHSAFDSKSPHEPARIAGNRRAGVNSKMRRDTLEYRVLFTAAWAMFFVGTIVKRALNAKSRRRLASAQPAGHRSIFAEVTSSTNNAIACAFMG